MSDDRYASQGTVRVEWRSGSEAESSDPEVTLHFVPEHGYSVEHCGKTYAVFISQCRTNAIIRCCGKGGVRIEGQVAVESVSCAAVSQVKVEVIVKEKDNHGLRLVSVTIPAK